MAVLLEGAIAFLKSLTGKIWKKSFKNPALDTLDSSVWFEIKTNV